MENDRELEDGNADEFSDADLKTDNGMMQTDAGLMTIVRRDCASPELSTERRRMMEFMPDDTSNLFQPVRTLNFSDTDTTQEDVTHDDDNQNGENQFARTHNEAMSAGSNLIDLDWMEEGNENQNMRIIEGHDSSPLEVVRSSVMVTYVGASQQYTSPSGHGSQTSQPASQSQQNQALSQTTQQYNQTDVSQSAFSPLKEDLDMSGRGSPNLYDSLDERDAENSPYGVRRPHRGGDDHQYAVSGVCPPTSVGNDYHGNDSLHRNIVSSQQQMSSFDEDVLLNSNNKENVSPKVNTSPRFTSDAPAASQSGMSGQEFRSLQHIQGFDKPNMDTITGSLASWEDAGIDAENVTKGPNSLRCAVVGHSVAASSRGGRSNSQPRLADHGHAPPCPRLVRTEQRQATNGLAGQPGTGRGNPGRPYQARGMPSRGVGRSRPLVQGAGHPRPVVQGSSVADTKKSQKAGITTNVSRPTVNERRGAEPVDRSLDRISGVGSEGPQTRGQIGVGDSDSRSGSRTPPIHVQTSVTSPRIAAALSKNSNAGQESMISCLKMTSGFGQEQDDQNDNESVHTQMDALSSASFKASPKQVCT